MGDISGAIHEGSRDVSEMAPGTLAAGLWASISVATLQTGSLTNTTTPTESPHMHEYICSRILNQLDFPDRILRENQIEQAFPETFQWLLHDDQTNERHTTTFKDWIESDTCETPFWITGIPASGKSTLMKFICTDPSVWQCLQSWAGELPLLMCRVYFWNPGSMGQKSQEGLMKNLLHQLLDQLQDLCPVIASRRYLYFQLAGRDALDPPNWTEEALREAILNCISEIGNTHRLAIFLDGLDEYDGDLESLVAFIHQLQRGHKSTKLCVSSRPWNIFRDAFRAHPSLKMEQFTKPDIEKYVRTRIADSPAFQDLRRIDASSVDKMESTIIDKANGIFLWVVLVVEQAIKTARDNSDLREIWKLIETLPEGLEELYQAIRGRLNPSLRRKASQMYQLMFWSAEIEPDLHIEGLQFWVAMNFDLNYHKHSMPQQYPHGSALEALPGLLERDLTGATGGMLQVVVFNPGTMSVQFLHRSVYDWLREIRLSIIADGPDGYEPSLVMCSASVSQVRLLASEEKTTMPDLLSVTNAAFIFGGYCNNSPRIREQLVWVLGGIPLDEIRRRLLSSTFRDALDPRGMNYDCIVSSNSDSLYLLALANSCGPYIQAGIDDKSFIPWSSTRNPFQKPRPRKDYLSIITRVALDGAGHSAGGESDLNCRLRTVGILTRAGFLPQPNFVEAVQDSFARNPEKWEYFEALLFILKGNGFVELDGDLDRFVKRTGSTLSLDERFKPVMETPEWKEARKSRNRGFWGHTRMKKRKQKEEKAKRDL